MLLHEVFTHSIANKASVAFWREFHFNRANDTELLTNVVTILGLLAF